MKTLPSPSSKTRRWLCAGAVGLAAVAVPASASAATPSNPQVAQINPTTGTVTSLAGGAPWTKLGGIAISPSGTLYVANQGPLGPSPRGAGIYSLTAPGFAITPVASTPYPMSVVASGSSLYALDTDRVLSLTGSAPTVVSSGGLYDQNDVVPEYGAVAGNTMYTTASSSCDQAEGGGSFVIAVNLTTGAQSLTKNFGCTPISGIAATPGGELLVAQPGKITELDPYTGVTGTLTSGGQLATPQGIALNPAGDLLVADSTSGVIAVDPETGDQSPVTTPGAVAGASGITVGQDGDHLRHRGGPAADAARLSRPPAAFQRRRDRVHRGLQPHLQARLQHAGPDRRQAGLRPLPGVRHGDRTPSPARQAAQPGQPPHQDGSAARQEGRRHAAAQADGPQQRRQRQDHDAEGATHATVTAAR